MDGDDYNGADEEGDEVKTATANNDEDDNIMATTTTVMTNGRR